MVVAELAITLENTEPTSSDNASRETPKSQYESDLATLVPFGRRPKVD